MNNLQLEILYLNPLITKIGKIMSKCDLGISGIEKAECEILTIETKTKIDKKYILMMKKQVKKFYKDNDLTVIGIKVIL